MAAALDVRNCAWQFAYVLGSTEQDETKSLHLQPRQGDSEYCGARRPRGDEVWTRLSTATEPAAHARRGKKGVGRLRIVSGSDRSHESILLRAT